MKRLLGELGVVLRGAWCFVSGLIINHEPGAQLKSSSFCYLHCACQLHLLALESLISEAGALSAGERAVRWRGQ